MNVGHGERHRVAAVVGVGVSRADARTAGPVPEGPGIGQGVTVGVGRAGAGEAHGDALGAGIGARRRGGGGVIRGGVGVMARAAPRVGERLAGDGNEFPVVPARRQGQLEDAERLVVARLGVGDGRSQGVEIGPAGARNDFADPEGGIGHAGGRLRREALVVVVMPIEDQLCSGLVQRLPQRPGRSVDRDGARAEQGMVPVGEGALRRVGCEICAQPLLLGGPCDRGGIAVQRNDVPRAEVVAVIAGRGVARRRPEAAPGVL